MKQLRVFQIAVLVGSLLFQTNAFSYDSDLMPFSKGGCSGALIKIVKFKDKESNLLRETLGELVDLLVGYTTSITLSAPTANEYQKWHGLVRELIVLVSNHHFRSEEIQALSDEIVTTDAFETVRGLVVRMANLKNMDSSELSKIIDASEDSFVKFLESNEFSSFVETALLALVVLRNKNASLDLKMKVIELSNKTINQHSKLRKDTNVENAFAYGERIILAGLAVLFLAWLLVILDGPISQYTGKPLRVKSFIIKYFGLD